MTMKAMLVNTGNRTGDVLVLEKHVKSTDPEKPPTVTRREIRRGQQFDIHEFTGYDAVSAVEIKIWSESRGQPGPNDSAGTPQIIVTDPPRAD